MTTIYPSWTNELNFKTPKSLGHVIGVGGSNIKYWYKKYNCKVIINKYLYTINIIGYDESSVLKTTIEVQEKLLMSWKYIELDYINMITKLEEDISNMEDQLNETDGYIDTLNKEIKEKESAIYKLKFPHSPKMRHIPGWGCVLDE